MMIDLVFQIISLSVVIFYTAILLLSREGGGEREAVREEVKVLVPTHNEVDTIEDCLRSLLSMKTRIPHSIYVLDDNSTDGTLDIVSGYTPRVSLVRRDVRKSKADALNEAVSNLDGELFAVVDADCTVAEDWLPNMVLGFGDPSLGIRTGPVLVGNRSDSPLTRIQSCEMAFLCHQLLKPVEKVGMLYSINGNNFAFTRTCWEKVGGFDTSKLTEDTDFAVRTRLAGMDIEVANAKVFTNAPSRLGNLLRQRRRWYIGWYQDLSTISLLGGALFILLFYYAFIFFLVASSPLSLTCFLAYYLQLAFTYRRSYRSTSLVNPLLFIVSAPIITTTTILMALPSVIRGKGQIDLKDHWQ